MVLLTLLLGNAGSAHQEESKRELEALLTAVVEEFGFAVRFSRLQRFGASLRLCMYAVCMYASCC